MATFAVILNEPNERVAARLRETFPEPNHLSLSPTVYLVSGDLLVDALTAALGFAGDDAIDDAVGVVFRLNGTWGGRSYQSVWDWLARADAVVA